MKVDLSKLNSYNWRRMTERKPSILDRIPFIRSFLGERGRAREVNQFFNTVVEEFKRLDLVRDASKTGQLELTEQYEAMPKNHTHHFWGPPPVGGITRTFENIEIRFDNSPKGSQTITLGWEEAGYATRTHEEIHVTPSSASQHGEYFYRKVVYDRTGRIVALPREARYIGGTVASEFSTNGWSYHKERFRVITEVLDETKRLGEDIRS